MARGREPGRLQDSLVSSVCVSVFACSRIWDTASGQCLKTLIGECGGALLLGVDLFPAGDRAGQLGLSPAALHPQLFCGFRKLPSLLCPESAPTSSFLAYWGCGPAVSSPLKEP